MNKDDARSFALQAARGHLTSMEKLFLALIDGDISNPIAEQASDALRAASGGFASQVEREGSFIRTSIFIDITGLDASASSGDIIGVGGGGDAVLGRYTLGQVGAVVAASLTCLEAPAGAQDDIDLFSAVENTGVEDGAISGLTETQLINAGTLVNGATVGAIALPADGEYLYLVTGAATGGGTYTAGKILLQLWSVPA